VIVHFRPGAAPGVASALTAKSRSGAPPASIPAAKLSNPNRPESLNKLDRQYGLREGRPLFSRHSAAAPKARFKNVPGKTGTTASGAAGDVWLLRLDPAMSMDQALKEYRANPAVISAEPNYTGSLAYVPSDPLYAQERTDLSMIGLEQAWNIQRGANASVHVAVIDSGIDPMHPDLAGALDLADSYNFIDKNSAVFDDIGHGTRVAGIIGATANNGEGISGVAFGCKMMSLDVVDPTGIITVADVATAIEWALAHNADVINISLTFHSYSVTLDGACRDAAAMGALVVAAAGNESQGNFPVYPAALEGVLGIGAVAPDGISGSGFPPKQLQWLRRRLRPLDPVTRRVPGPARLAFDPTRDSALGSVRARQEADEMPEHRIGSREEWQAARDELAKLEAEQAERNEEIKKKRLDLPWPSSSTGARSCLPTRSCSAPTTRSAPAAIRCLNPRSPAHERPTLGKATPRGQRVSFYLPARVRFPDRPSPASAHASGRPQSLQWWSADRSAGGARHAGAGRGSANASCPRSLLGHSPERHSMDLALPARRRRLAHQGP
jgi:hypothetical protein